MGQPVSATVSIKCNRAANIDTDRLVRRREFLRDLLTMRSFEIETRHMFAVKALELHAIENALESRDSLPDPRITLRSSCELLSDTVRSLP